MNSKTKVLVLDASQRSSLAVVRSLGQRRDIQIIAADCFPAALAGCSRFCDAYHQYPSPQKNPYAFIDWLVAFIAREGVDSIFPITEITSQLVLMHRPRFGACRIPFADYDTVMALADKWRLVNLAEKLQVAHPASTYYANALACTAVHDHPFPLVLKPCLSRLWLGDRWLDTTVHIVRDAQEMDVLLKEKVYFREHPFMVQQFIPGHGAGIFAIYERGNPVAFFAHKRLREKPPAGGVSVLSESAQPEPHLHAMAKKLLDAVHWHGVAMVEFRVADNGDPYLMEINTRFWGSLQLAIDAGIDFPGLLFDITHDRPLTNPPPYRVGQRLRWLLGDLDNLYLSLRDGRIGTADKLGKVLAFLTPHPLSTKHEVNRWNDLGPAWHELKSYVKALRSR